jgi:hypothetical protein
VAALRVCDQVMKENPGISCFPYTIFYVYFEQYLNIIAVMVLVLALAAGTSVRPRHCDRERHGDGIHTQPQGV